MADETVAAVNETPVEVKAAEPVGTAKKTRAPRKKAEQKPAKAAGVSTSKAARAALDIAKPAVGRTIKKYTPAQRASILASVEKATKNGKTTLKAALQQLEVSEQTYYNWKNAAVKAAPAAAKTMANDDLKSLVALEAENLKLRKELAAKLRAENEELRKRLGQA